MIMTAFPFYFTSILLAALSICTSTKTINVNDYGAINATESTDDAFKNAAAFTAAFEALKANPQYDTLLFPSTFTYYIFPISISELHNKTIIFDSMIMADNNIASYPHSGSQYDDVFKFNNISNIMFRGSGRIEFCTFNISDKLYGSKSADTLTSGV